MTITLPTSEFVGLISDVLAFAPQDKDATHRGVLLEWDGEQLTAAAHDVLSGGQSSWGPGEAPEAKGDVAETLADIRWGSDGTDKRARLFISYDDAKELIKVYKLPEKFGLTPVTLDLTPYPPMLYVGRPAMPWCTSQSTRVSSAPAEEVEGFPDVTDVTENAIKNATATPWVSDGLAYSGLRMALFGTVRQWDVMAMTLTGETSMTVVNIGDRFVGWIFPARAKHQAANATLTGGGS